MSINLKEHEEEDDDLIILPEMDNLVQPADPELDQHADKSKYNGKRYGQRITRRLIKIARNFTKLTRNSCGIRQKFIYNLTKISLEPAKISFTRLAQNYTEKNYKSF